MKLQEFLRSGGTFQQLEDKWAIKAVQSVKYPELFLFKYNQIDSPFSEEIVRESRGVILSQKNNWKVICRAYDKFFNYGEGLAAKIDWDKAICYEKLDGSICNLWYYDGKWNVSTSGSPDASGEVNGFGFTFAELFWKTWNELGYKYPSMNFDLFDADYTYIFELCTKYNQIVVRHEEPRIVLHGIRDTIEYFDLEDNSMSEVILSEKTGNSIYYNELYNWEIVKTFQMNNLDSIIDFTKTIDPMQMEGFVVFDGVNRIKIKSEQYVALHSIKSGMSEKRLLEIILVNEGSEFLVYFPEYAEKYNELKTKFNNLISSLEKRYELIKDIKEQKEFALSISGLPFTGAFFMLRAGKIKTIREYFQNININNILDYFKD